MPVDLTRFDFHVHRFLNSPDVESMTAAEVGQYVLLLCKSWANGDECCLPDDNKYLCRVARVKVLSPLVRGKFEVTWVPAGPQQEANPGTNQVSKLRNSVLYAGWLEAKNRSDVAESKARKRWEPEVPNAANGNATALPGQCRAYAQTNPTNPTQTTNPTNGGQVGETVDMGELLPDADTAEKTRKASPGGGSDGKSVFKRIARVWIAVKGPAAVARYPKKYGESWESLCINNNSKLIVDAFELWCREEGKYTTTQFPTGPFCAVAQDYMERIAGSTEVIRPAARTEEQIAQDTKAFQPIADANLKGVLERQAKAVEVSTQLKKDLDEGNF